MLWLWIPLALVSSGWFLWAVMRQGSLTYRMVDEINVTAKPTERVPAFPTSLDTFTIAARHRQLFPESDISRQRRDLLLIAAGAGLALAGCVRMIVLILSD